MSSIPSLLTRPSALGIIAIAGSGAFYVGLKYKTLTAPPPDMQTQSSGAPAEAKEQNYEVKPGREGGGV
ncbi:hypothetical protein MMC21_003580 [Puttea exsequens]|nr:hypothetical protein [Puttea exsequens]